MKSIVIFLFVAGLPGVGFSQANDSVAIVKVLEKESATWRSGDSTAHAACWQIEPYSTVIIMNGNGKTFTVPTDKIIHPTPGTMGKGGTSKNENYSMSIHGNTALITHKETSTASDGAISHTYELRMLEKISGTWKLTGEIIQIL